MKKGFTLIELLAVILILGIIALIAVPQVTNVIDDAREQANLRSVEGHVKNIENNLAVNMLNNVSLKGAYSFEDLNFTNYQANDDIKCDFYEISKTNVTGATKCMINGKSYCYSNGKGFACNVIDHKSYAQANGQLHVCGTELCNESNKKIRLMGASLSNGVIGQGPSEYSLKALSQLKSWGANLLRIFVDGQASWNGMYAYIGNESEYMNSLYEAIDNAIANDMYVIVNWASHASNDDPLIETASSMFTQVATKYQNDPHIIYEIWNESGTSKTWNDIKNYANQIIPAIRNISPNAIIIVATPRNNLNVDEVIDSPLTYENVMYSHHLYISGFSTASMNRLKKAIDAGIPIFTTEWAATDGGETVDYNKYEAQAFDYAKILDKYNISYAMFCFHATKWSYGFVRSGQWDEDLPVRILTPNALFLRKILVGNYESPGHTMRGFTGNGTEYRSDEWINQIEEVEFANRINIPKDAEEVWDLSIVGDNSVVGYVTKIKNSSLYKLTIAANGYVNAPNNARMLFANMTNLKKINFSNFKTIYTTSLLGMFAYDSNIEELDLSGFDVSRVINLTQTFTDMTNVKKINLTGWKLKPTVMPQMFANCTHLESIDLRGFDVTNVQTFSYMFSRTLALTSLDISNWNPMNVTNMNTMFYNNIKLDVLDMSNFVFGDSTTINANAFAGIKSGAIVYVKNQDIKERILAINSNLDVRIK